MRRAIRETTWQLVVALLLGAVATFLVERAGTFVTTLVLLILLTWLAVLALAVLRARLATRRFPPHMTLGNRGNGWDPTGVREPRRPRPPYMPPAAAAAEPDRTFEG